MRAAIGIAAAYILVMRTEQRFTQRVKCKIFLKRNIRLIGSVKLLAFFSDALVQVKSHRGKLVCKFASGFHDDASAFCKLLIPHFKHIVGGRNGPAVL